MDLHIVLAERRGPLWTDTEVIFHAQQQWAPTRQWSNVRAFWYRSKDADTFNEGAYAIPVDPDFIICRVKADNCPWVDVGPAKQDPNLPWREVRVEYCVYTNANGYPDYERSGRDGFDFVRHYYECSACGMKSTVDDSISAPHPVKGTYLQSGFGFDSARGVFTASDEPGALMFLASIKPDPWWKPNPPRATTAYAQRHGLLTDWTPIQSGSIRKGIHSACTYLVLRANQSAAGGRAVR